MFLSGRLGSELTSATVLTSLQGSAATDGEPRFAVLLATFNGAAWLREQIESVLAQKGVCVTLHVSDDCSTDTTPAIIAGYVGRGNVHVLPRTDRLGSAAANFFRLLRDLDFTDVDYVAFCDQDDVWYEDKLLRAAQAIRSRNVDAVSSNVLAFWPEGREALVRKDHAPGRWNHLFESAGPGCTCAFTRQVALGLAETIRKDPETMKDVGFHDWFAYAWVKSKGLRWWVDPVPTMRYRQHGKNVIGANANLAGALRRWKMLAGGWYRAEVLRLAEVCGASEVPPAVRLRRFSLIDRVVLACQVGQFRRLWRDRCAVACAFLLPLGHSVDEDLFNRRQDH